MVVFQVKAHKDISHFETAYVVKIHNAARLAPCQSVRFTVQFIIYIFDTNLLTFLGLDVSYVFSLVIIDNLISFLSVGFLLGFYIYSSKTRG